MSLLAFSDSFESLYDVSSTIINMFTFIVRGCALDVSILTFKVDPRAVRVDLQTIKFEGELSITINISAYIVITLILLITTIVVFDLFY